MEEWRAIVCKNGVIKRKNWTVVGVETASREFAVEMKIELAVKEGVTGNGNAKVEKVHFVVGF